MSIRLSFETGTLAGMHIITGAPSISLGREPVNDLVLSMPMVSRRHATLSKSVRGFYSIEIIGSGPSHINSESITPIAGRPTIRQLSGGDHIDLAGVQFTVAEAEVRLMCVLGPAAGKDFLLTGNATVGRATECDFVISDPSVSRKHLAINATPSGFVIQALSAAAFNGKALPSRMLAHGDEIVIGDSVLRVNVKVTTDDNHDSVMLGAGMPTIIISAELTAVGELVFIAGAAKGEKILLGDDQIIIGNSDSATRTISDPLASPMHLAISKAGDQFVATDLRSERGTFINGKRIDKGTELKPGDLIAIGSHVLESRMLGGVRMERRNSSTFSVAPEEPAGPQPKFVIDGRVMQTPRAVIGRVPTCDMIVDHREVSREHCVLEWDAGGGFFVRDTSSHGTYLDDKRVVRAPLTPSCVLRVGNTLFRIAARGEVCTIERTDAALAEAAVAVAREQASQLAATPGGRRSARGATVLPPSLAASLAGAPAGTSLARSGPKLVVPGLGLKTMFRLDVSDLGQLEQEIQAKKKDLQRGAPAWRPSSDLTRQNALRGAVVLSVLAALAVCGGAIAMSGGRALVNHPLSAAHSSAAFTAKAGVGTSCASCHSAGARVDNSRCVNCHTKFEPRTKHNAFVCAKCHAEHDGAPANSALGANDHCAECHAGQHAKELAVVGPQKIAAGPLPMTFPVALMGSNMTDPRMIALHVAHTKVTVAGKDVGIGCTACHGAGAAGSAKAAAGGLPAFAAFPAGLACYRCHTGGEDPAKLRCEGCHGVEHAASPKTPPVVVGSTTQDTIDPTRSLEWAGGLGLIGGAPALLFGLVMRVRRRGSSTKMVEQLKSHPAEVVKRLVHSINDSKCVGCGLCVQACPASVLELVEHKSRVVNFDSCIQCKRCEGACAFDALRMHDADKPPPMIAYPSIDAFYETPVAGMFLVGQVSGTPQVKNATNLGRAVAQRIVQRGYTPGSGKALGCELDVIIVGSGPGGLSAALTCIELGLSYVVLEKEREFSWTIRNYYHKGKEVMAEPHDIELEATLPHWDSSREELLGAWQELVVQNHVDIRYQHNVIDIAKQGDKFVVGVGDKGKPNIQLTAGRVIIAIGTLGNPRTLGCPGEELAKVKNSLVDPDEWRGKSILVVGGSDSAVEVVLALCQPQRNNKVYFSTRGAKLEGIKPKNRKLIEDALAAGQFEIRYATAVADVTATTVGLTFKEDNRREDLPNDVIFAMIGGNSPQKWLQQIGVPYIEKPHSWSPTRTDQLAQKTAEGLVQIRRIPRKPVPEYKPHH